MAAFWGVAISKIGENSGHFVCISTDKKTLANTAQLDQKVSLSQPLILKKNRQLSKTNFVHEICMKFAKC